MQETTPHVHSLFSDVTLDTNKHYSMKTQQGATVTSCELNRPHCGYTQPLRRITDPLRRIIKPIFTYGKNQPVLLHGIQSTLRGINHPHCRFIQPLRRTIEPILYGKNQLLLSGIYKTLRAEESITNQFVQIF